MSSKRKKPAFPTVPGGGLQQWEDTRHWAGPEELTRLVVESSGDGLISIAESGKLEVFNPAMQELTGYKSAEALGKSYRRLLQPMDETGAEIDLRELASEAGQDPLRPASTITIKTARGRRWVGVTAAAQRSHEHNHYIVVIRDISQQYEMQKRQLEFVSIASHELRTPITAMSGYLSLAQAELRKKEIGRQPLERFISRAYDASIRLTELVEDLLNVVRLEEGRMVFRPTILSPVEPLQEILTAMRPAITGKQLALTVDDRLKPNDLIRVDRGRFDQVFANLIDNAIKYTPPGGQLRISARPGTRWVSFSIKDTGIGIHPENLGRIYEKFFREYTDFSATAGGTGLGLYITKELVERQGGLLKITSAPDQGTTATVRFPRATGRRPRKNVH